MKRIMTSHAQFSLRHTNDRDVHIHHAVSRYGYHILKTIVNDDPNNHEYE